MKKVQKHSEETKKNMILTRRGIKMKPYLVFLFLFLLASIPIVISQNSQNQIIDLRTDIKNYFVELSRGNIAGESSILKFGFNPAIGTAEEDIWTVGGILIFQTTAMQYNISSTDTDDNIAGSGARKIEIQGLDSNFNEISEIVNLSGTTVVQTTKEYIRLNRGFITNVGTYTGSNEGVITISTSDTGDPQGGILVQEGQTQKSHFTIPAGKTLSDIYTMK